MSKILLSGVEEEAKASLADCEGVLENAKEKFADFQKDVKGVTRRFSEQKERLKVEIESARKEVIKDLEATAMEIWLQIGKALMMVRTEIRDSPFLHW